MILSMIFSMLIFIIVVYVISRVLGNILYGIFLIVLVFIASYLFIGSFPNVKEVPIVGRWLPDLTDFPRTTGGVINIIKSSLFNLNVLDYSKTSSGNLLIIVANTGKVELSDFNVIVDGRPVDVLNNPKDPLKSGESTAIEVDWKGNFNAITVNTKETSASYSAA